jgi:sucrose-6-phosphate hydrolase SacC (GH32 family)
VPEIESLYRKSHTLSDLTIAAASEVLSTLKPELVDLSIEFAPGDDGIVDLTVRGVKITYGKLMKLKASSGEVREVKCFSFNGKSCPAPLIDGKVQLRVLADRVSLELYVNGGAAVASSYEFDMAQDEGLTLSANREIPIKFLEVHELKSIWEAK